MRKLLMAACAVLAMTGAAHGGELKPYATVGGWNLFASNEHCAAGADYLNGTSLIFGVNTDGEAWLKVYNDAWKIPNGTYSVGVRIDKVEFEDMKFAATEDGNSIIVQIEMSEAIYNLFTKGNLLSLSIGGSDYQYFLKDTSVMIPRLLTCIKDVASATNPFGAPQTAPVSTPTNPFKRT